MTDLTEDPNAMARKVAAGMAADRALQEQREAYAVADAASALDRSTYIGSADAPMIAGLSTYGGPLAVWMRKVGLADGPDESLRMRLGTLLEPIVLELYADQTGLRPERVVEPDADAVRDTEYDFIGAHPDYDHLEIKTTSRRQGWGEEGEDVTPENMAIPPSHFVQVQHQMRVMEWDRLDIAVLIGLGKFGVYSVPRNEDVIARLVVAEVELWEAVQTGVPPEDDDPVARKALLASLYPSNLEPPRAATPEESVSIEHWRQAKKSEAEAKRVVEIAANEVKGLIGQASGLTGEATWKEQSRVSYDAKALVARLTELGERDTIEAARRESSFRVLRDTK